ncbi:hypothetical protein [Elongatibacter sediminis]|uniref:Phosphatidate cytidylyltransferase n=1 Tax=Elongatibacter sediminis TaxID=3119006 RepID=A0AAW9RFH3_9GAMM
MADDALAGLVRSRMERILAVPDERRDALLARLLERHGAGIAAVLVYGSYLRGKRDTLLDFYVLMDGYGTLRPVWQAGLAWLLSPNVYQVAAGSPPDEARAKYALLTLGRFERAMRRDFHPYFWARFAQPCGLVYCRDDATRERVTRALATAGRHFVRRVVPRLPAVFTPRELALTGLGLTYGCELRSEGPGRAAGLYQHDEAWYGSLTAALSGTGLGYGAADRENHYRNHSGEGRRRLSWVGWQVCRILGKFKSALRLLKAALTFDGGLDYILWKIARHSGHYIEPTERQRRHPLLFGWPLLWRLYRRGAFR